MLTARDKKIILDAFKMVDVKKLDIEVDDISKKKWFRFGSYNGMMIASEIIKNLPEKTPVKKQIKVT